MKFRKTASLFSSQTSDIVSSQDTPYTNHTIKHTVSLLGNRRLF